MSLDNTVEVQLLNSYFRGVTFSPPGTLYVGLFTVAPTDATAGTEVSGSNYARMAIPSNTASWTSASGDPTAIVNAIDLLSNASTGSPWGTIVALGLFTAASAGTRVAWGALAANQTPALGDRVTLDAGSISVTCD